LTFPRSRTAEEETRKKSLNQNEKRNGKLKFLELFIDKAGYIDGNEVKKKA